MMCLTFSENSPLSQDCADTSSRRKERAGWCRSNSAGIGVQDLLVRYLAPLRHCGRVGRLMAIDRQARAAFSHATSHRKNEH